jgi:actin related protein 2/3 complex subunit 5
VRTHAQNANREVVVECLLGVREDKIKKTIKSLDPECYDLLMKYIYRGLENGKRSSTLFKWHSCLFDVTGIGAVTRVMTDRKTI